MELVKTLRDAADVQENGATQLLLNLAADRIEELETKLNDNAE